VFPTNLLRYLLLKGAAEEAMKIWLGQTISTKIGLSDIPSHLTKFLTNPTLVTSDKVRKS
jgi:hypothetical protein